MLCQHIKVRPIPGTKDLDSTTTLFEQGDAEDQTFVELLFGYCFDEGKY
jgi:hypothetical protein